MGLPDRIPLRNLPTQAQRLERAFLGRTDDTLELQSVRSSDIAVSARAHPLSFQKKEKLRQARAGMLDKLKTPAERAALGYATKLVRAAFNKYRRGWRLTKVTRKICGSGQIKMYGMSIEEFAKLIAVQARRLVGEDCNIDVYSWGENITCRLFINKEPVFVMKKEGTYDIEMFRGKNQ